MLKDTNKNFIDQFSEISYKNNENYYLKRKSVASMKCYRVVKALYQKINL